jgi:hypothetical protein
MRQGMFGLSFRFANLFRTTCNNYRRFISCENEEVWWMLAGIKGEGSRERLVR